MKWFFHYALAGSIALIGLAYTEENSFSKPSTYQLNRFPHWNLVEVPKIDPKKGEIKIAFWNILTQLLTDSKRNPYPKYKWDNRIKPMLQLILKDAPDVLGFCECTLNQANDFQQQLQSSDYSIAGYSSALHKTIGEVMNLSKYDSNLYYGEFVGFLFNAQRLELQKLQCHELKKGEKHKRILVQGDFFDKITGTSFTVLASHFDHLSMESIEKSGKKEREIIEELERKNIPWFSIGDRNWPCDMRGETFAKQYAEQECICDFRDNTMKGHFGPSGTFPGHLWMTTQPLAPIERLEGFEVIAAATIDVGYRSHKLLTGVCSYALTGEFSPDTFELLPETEPGNLEQRNFASDHYYIGGIFRFNK